MMLRGIRQNGEIVRRLKDEYSIVVSGATVSQDIKILREKSIEFRMVENVEDEMNRDLLRIERAINSIFDKVENGDLGAIRAFAVLIDQKAKILGYYQPLKVDITTIVRKIAEIEGINPDRFAYNIEAAMDDVEYKVLDDGKEKNG